MTNSKHEEVANRTSSNIESNEIDIEGFCDSSFEEARIWLADYLQKDGLGGSLCVVLDGQVRVHLWGGRRSAATGAAWTADTLACLFSAGKAMAAVAVLRLVADGRISLDDPVARHWPAFAAHGKDAITVRELLAHRACVPVVDAARPGDVFDRQALAGAMEAQVPLFPPGTRGCFHSFTYGVLAGELVRRVDGRSFGRFFHEEIAAPLGIDIEFSLDQPAQARTADLVLLKDNPLLLMMRDPATRLGRGWAPLPWDSINQPRFRAADFPSLAGHGTALGLARFYAALAGDGRTDRGTLLPPSVVAEFTREQWNEPDALIGAPMRMGLGVMLANPLLPLTGSPTAFGQPGLGGVAGFGDASARLGVGFVPNRLVGAFENPPVAALIGTILGR